MAASLLSTHALHQGRRATVYKRPGRHFLHMCGHLGSGSRCFCVYSSTGVLFPTFLGEKSLALNPSLKKTSHCIRTLWASSSYICPLYVIIVDVNLPGQRGGCHLACLCITDDTLGHNQWPNDNYDPTVLRATLPALTLQILLANLKPKSSAWILALRMFLENTTEGSL